MTNQEIFNKVFLGLKSQGFAPSRNEHGECAYRGESGKKCAIGHLIPDEKYDPEFEGRCVAFVEKKLFAAAGLEQSQTDLADSLQSAHDYNDVPTDIEQKLLAVAKEFNLTVPE